MARHRGPMEAGDRRHLVTVQIRPVSDTPAASGFPVDTWTDDARVWMSKEDASAREKFMADQLSASFDTRWEMGYTASMDPDLVDVPKRFRLLYQGRYYDIVSASQIGARDGVELMTLAGSRVDA